MTVKVEALIFDFDGLLLDTEWPLFVSWREAYAIHGVELGIEEWAASIGTVDALDPMAELERRTGRPLDRQSLQATRKSRRDEMIEALDACEGATEVIDQASALGLPMAIASSSSPDWVDAHLRRLGLRESFCHLSCFEGRGSAKPAPDLYLKALDALGMQAGSCLAFEDSHNGLLAAKAASLRCVVVPTRLTKDMDFSLADLVVSRLGIPPLTEIIRLIETC